MSPRLTDWSIALATALALATGLTSLVSGRPERWLVFALHGAAGLWLLLLLWGKLARVLPRLASPRRWDRATLAGAGAALLAALVLGTALAWVLGAPGALLGYNLLNWHVLLSLLLTLVVSTHMLARAKPLRRRDLPSGHDRRQLLRFIGLAAGAGGLWGLERPAARLLGLPGAQRRFTGSRERDSFQGNAFPTVSWLADRPAPIELPAWRLRVAGAVARPQELAYGDLLSPELAAELEATLDCTGGFYTTQRWRGAAIGRLLERAGPLPEARWVRFVSVTGYRWSLPIDEARAALLATHVGGEPLAHGHGAPARLVAPGRRGLEWVKWVVRIEPLSAPDPGQILAIFGSGLRP